MSAPSRAQGAGRSSYMVVGLALLFVGVSITVVQYKVPSILESVMATYGMTSSTGSWLMSIFTMMGIFLSLPSGSLAKRFGPKNMMLAGCAVIVAGSVVGALATSAWLMIASRAVEGVAFVFISVAGPMAVERYVDDGHKGTVNGIWSLWICLGSFAGSTATPMVFEALGLTWTWLAYAGIVVVAAVVLAIAVRVPKGKTLDVAVEEEPEEKATLKDYAALLSLNTVLFLFAWLVFNILILAVLSYAPTFLQSQGMNASLSGLASSLPGILAIASSLVVGKLVDKTGRTKVFFVVAMAVSGPATLLMLTQSGPLLWVGAALVGLVGYGAPVACLAALPQIAGKRELFAAVMGCYALIMCLGEFLGSLVTPMLLGPDMANWTFCGAVMLGLGIAGAVAVALCKFK